MDKTGKELFSIWRVQSLLRGSDVVDWEAQPESIRDTWNALAVAIEAPTPTAERHEREAKEFLGELENQLLQISTGTRQPSEIFGIRNVTAVSLGHLLRDAQQRGYESGRKHCLEDLSGALEEFRKRRWIGGGHG